MVKPLPRTVFAENQVEEAFRFLATGKHKGKVLIQIRNEEPLAIRNPLRSISAKPKIYFNPNKSYVLVGGLGGVGLELADWMIRKGAKNILLNSRSGITTGYQKLCLKKWKQFEGIKVSISTYNSSDICDASLLISDAEELAPLGGKYHSVLECFTQ